MRMAARMSGVPLPAPEYVPFEDPDPILRWIRDVLSRGKTPHLHTFSSAAVQICRRAGETGQDLRTVQFQTGSELLTPARLQAIESAGAAAYPVYASMETGPIGVGCVRRAQADDLHILTDLHAVIQPGTSGTPCNLPPTGLLVTSLRRTATMLLLNVSMGDQAVISAGRSCGCPLEDLGWASHMYEVRSFEKLTAGGMTVLDFDAVRILEELLPRRFGGAAGDYQLVEDETADGKPQLSLLVSPSAGEVDTEAVARGFLELVKSGSPTLELMGRVWQEAGMLQVIRAAPLRTPTGKLLPIHRKLRGQTTVKT